MSFLPVSELVGQDGGNLTSLALLNEGIEDDDVLSPGKTIEVRVAVGAALRSVDDIEVLEGEFESGGQCLNLGSQRARLQRRELVEERQDKDRVDSDHEGLDEQDEDPCVVEEVHAESLDNLEETGEDRTANDGDQGLCLEEVGDELCYYQ